MLGRLPKNSVFIGVGNPMKGDDGIGPYIAERIPGAITAGTAPENFIGKIKGQNPDAVSVFDALDFDGKPGQIRVLEAKETKGLLLSTHSLPLSLFAEMLAPSRVILVGIQPKSLGFGEEMSDEVKGAAKKLLLELGV
jgi:hydrogenase 3 maturation protease